MDEVLARASARISRVVVFAACLALFAFGVIGLAGAQPDGRGSAGSGDAGGYVAASDEFLLGTKLLVTADGGSVVVSVSDRGPLEAGVDLDLSAAAAEEIGLPLGATAIVEVQVANPGAPTGPLVRGARGSEVVSNVFSTGNQQGSGSSQNNRSTTVVNGVEIASSEVLERVATSTGEVPVGVAPGGTRSGAHQYDQYAGGQYGLHQYHQTQYEGSPDDQGAPDSSQYGLDEYQYGLLHYAEDGVQGAQYDADQYGTREGARARAERGDDDATTRRSETGSGAERGGGGTASAGRDADQETDEASEDGVPSGAGSAGGSNDGSDGTWSDGGKENRPRGGLGALRELPETGGLPLAGALWAGLLSIGLIGALVHRMAR